MIIIRIEEAYNTGKLKKVFEGIPQKCLGNAVTLMSDMNAFINRFKDLTGIGFGEPIDESKEISDDNINELNYRNKDIERSINSLCSCVKRELK